jgi:hypothetical protein
MPGVSDAAPQRCNDASRVCQYSAVYVNAQVLSFDPWYPPDLASAVGEPAAAAAVKFWFTLLALHKLV